MTDGIILPFSTTLLVRDTCLCMHVQRAARALARRYDAVLRPFGLTNGQFSVLMALNRPGPVAMSDVAGLLAMDRTTLTAVLKPLNRRGYLVIAPDPHDKRLRGLTLTESGRAVLSAAMPAWTKMQGELEQRLPEADKLRAGLRSLS